MSRAGLELKGLGEEVGWIEVARLPANDNVPILNMVSNLEVSSWNVAIAIRHYSYKSYEHGCMF